MRSMLKYALQQIVLAQNDNEVVLLTCPAQPLTLKSFTFNIDKDNARVLLGEGYSPSPNFIFKEEIMKNVVAEKPAFGARVLVWDVRFKEWEIAIFVRDNDSNVAGHFERWLHGQSHTMTGARFWQELPEPPKGERS